MRKWIACHLWKLEVVPFVDMLLVIIVPLIFGTRLAIHLESEQVFSPYETWNRWYLWLSLTSVGIFAIGFVRNHEWIQIERSKRFNYWAPLFSVIIGAFGWAGFQRQFGIFWVSVSVFSCVLQVVIELNRQLCVQNQIPEEKPEVKIGVPFYYREFGRSSYPPSLFAQHFIIIFLIILPGYWVTGNFIQIPLLISVISILGIALISFRPVFTITNNCITFRAGLLRLGFPITQIKECTIFDYHFPLNDLESIQCKMMLWAPVNGRNLRIDTIDGKSYLLGLQKPETACALISGAIAN